MSYLAFCATNTANIDDLIESADDALFKQIILDPNHVLTYLLPVKTDVHYDFRPRRHPAHALLTGNLSYVG